MAEDLKARLEEEIGALCAKCAAFSRDESACDECPLPKLLEAIDALSQLLSSLLELEALLEKRSGGAERASPELRARLPQC